MKFSNNGLFGICDGTILDPVHGSIGWFNHEKKIFDHPLFQRLRFIKQTDIVNFVFIGSNHTRFEHSIGVMHMAGKIFSALTQSYLNEREYKESAKLTVSQTEAIQYLYWMVRVAGLLHDVGHFPFSHQFEFFLESFHEKDKKNTFLFSVDEIWKDIKDTSVIRTVYGETDTSRIAKHEDISLRIAYQILSDNKESFIENIHDVLYLMEKPQENKAYFDYLWANKDKEKNICSYVEDFHSIFIGELWKQTCEKGMDKEIIFNSLNLLKNIISGELDADKMDYLLRDSFYIGCSYGHFNVEHLLNSMRIGYERIKNKETGRYKNLRYYISVLDKGIGALEDFVYSRYQLYQEIYNHKTISGFRIILQKVFYEIFEENSPIRKKIEKDIKDIKDIKNWNMFTDGHC